LADDAGGSRGWCVVVGCVAQGFLGFLVGGCAVCCTRVREVLCVKVIDLEAAFDRLSSGRTGTAVVLCLWWRGHPSSVEGAVEGARFFCFSLSRPQQEGQACGSTRTRISEGTRPATHKQCPVPGIPGTKHTGAYITQEPIPSTAQRTTCQPFFGLPRQPPPPLHALLRTGQRQSVASIGGPKATPAAPAG